MSTLLSCMTDNSDGERLQLAVMHNHRELFRMNAEAMGGQVITDAGICYTFDGAGRQAMACLSDDIDVGDPSGDPSAGGRGERGGRGAGGERGGRGAGGEGGERGERGGHGECGGRGVGGPDFGEARAALDRMMAFYRKYIPAGIGWWSLAPARPAGIGALLLARGFQPGWKPCWMALDMGIDFGGGGVWPEGLQVEADNDMDLQLVRNLPYTGDQGAVSRSLLMALPNVVRQFVATLHGKIVGHCCVVLSDGPLGVAGLYNVGVVPEARERGVGKALVVAGCRWARERGMRYAVLNGTGRRMYEQVGFRWVGDGQTWWGMNPLIFERKPDASQVAFAEAVGLGDLAALRQMVDGESEEAPIAVQGLLGPGELDRPLMNKQTFLQLAIHCHQLAAGQWLVEQGASCTVLEAWDLGWAERAAALLRQDPGLVNMRYGEGRKTILHIATERNDMGLLELGLAAGPDLNVRDGVYGTTALRWAKVFGRVDMEGLLGG